MSKGGRYSIVGEPIVRGRLSAAREDGWGLCLIHGCGAEVVVRVWREHGVATLFCDAHGKTAIELYGAMGVKCSSDRLREGP